MLIGKEDRTLWRSKLRETRSRVGVTEEAVVEELPATSDVSGEEFCEVPVLSISEEKRDIKATPPPAPSPPLIESDFASLIGVCLLAAAAAAAAAETPASCRRPALTIFLASNSAAHSLQMPQMPHPESPLPHPHSRPPGRSPRP